MNSARSAPQLIGLLLHARHRELARVIHRLSQHAELLALVPHRLLETDVVDRAAEHESDRLEPSLLDEQELVDREVAGEEPACDVLLHPRDPLAARRGDAGQRARLIGRGVRRLIGDRAGPRAGPGRLGALVVVVTLQESHCSS
jgi:hypothetical protein